ncbi:ABC transporter permease [Leifsonia sp. Leaf264]|uniref:ABC transporter permease n=1 Tax=Leifsonia sp. Leaf264 TaxID=1736314 RepID=UPI0009E8E9F2|nr:ABC transporter permease [Leifsonia sp. Leaf264]
MTTSSPPVAGTRVSFGGVFASEWLKFRSLRSSWWLAGSAIVGTLLIVAFWSAAVPGASLANVLAAVANGYIVCGLLLIIVGTMISTSDYENHAITVFLAAVPSRTPIVLAKVLLAAIIGAVVGGVAGALALAVSIALHGGGASFGDPGVLRVLGDVAFYGAVLCVTGTTVGLVFRSTIASVGVAIGYLFIVPIIISLVPLDAFGLFSQTFPGNASSNFFGVAVDPGHLDPVSGVIASVIWTTAWVVFAVVWVKRRNA